LPEKNNQVDAPSFSTVGAVYDRISLIPAKPRGHRPRLQRITIQA